ncbi:fumarylacetoacetate hydrolase family protein [Telmatospirillum sp. J64-1]|uniref:fumarylacetoacetate hydrolase family protein n=1 Tax=Telmatospirillum sp. J64-1 TaxID=2502183 RepID=UPI00115D6F65|nr:fumarylacetoacetate hydrolase family protein [Telmatospirillum sp. J64-1]
MRLASFRIDDRQHVGAVSADGKEILPLHDSSGEPIRDMVEAIRRFDEIREVRLKGKALPLAEVRLEAPLPRPARNIFCVGKNYHAHAHEFTRSGFDSSASSQAEAIPNAPFIFTKTPETVIGHGQPILYPTGVSEKVDYEAELAVIIGKPGRGIAKNRALDHVWGYTILNDVTARDLQARHKQWFLGKSLDTFCPMGPWAVTADELDGSKLNLRCWVNGELRQDANTRDLIFDIPTLIETISAGITLQPGDVIATGTPVGVGIGFDPPKFLQPGDEVTIEIEGIGRLSNRLVEKP